jgi:hypothetical protein
MPSAGFRAHLVARDTPLALRALLMHWPSAQAHVGAGFASGGASAARGACQQEAAWRLDTIEPRQPILLWSTSLWIDVVDRCGAPSPLAATARAVTLRGSRPTAFVCACSIARTRPVVLLPSEEREAKSGCFGARSAQVVTRSDARDTGRRAPSSIRRSRTTRLTCSAITTRRPASRRGPRRR